MGEVGDVVDGDATTKRVRWWGGESTARGRNGRRKRGKGTVATLLALEQTHCASCGRQ